MWPVNKDTFKRLFVLVIVFCFTMLFSQIIDSPTYGSGKKSFLKKSISPTTTTSTSTSTTTTCNILNCPLPKCCVNNVCKPATDPACWGIFATPTPTPTPGCKDEGIPCNVSGECCWPLSCYIGVCSTDPWKACCSCAYALSLGLGNTYSNCVLYCTGLGGSPCPCDFDGANWCGSACLPQNEGGCANNYPPPSSNSYSTS